MIVDYREKNQGRAELIDRRTGAVLPGKWFYVDTKRGVARRYRDDGKGGVEVIFDAGPKRAAVEEVTGDFEVRFLS